MYIHMLCVCMCVHVPWHRCGGQRTVHGNWFWGSNSSVKFGSRQSCWGLTSPRQPFGVVICCCCAAFVTVLGPRSNKLNHLWLKDKKSMTNDFRGLSEKLDKWTLPRWGRWWKKQAWGTVLGIHFWVNWRWTLIRLSRGEIWWKFEASLVVEGGIWKVFVCL